MCEGAGDCWPIAVMAGDDCEISLNKIKHLTVADARGRKPVT